MRIAILSDLHFGDPMCSLSASTGFSRSDVGPAYAQFKSAVGADLDYLVLVGDIFDFSVASYSEAYRAAQPFFQRIASDGTLKRINGNPAARIVYVPGNHDFEVWHQVEYEVNVIRRMHSNKAPRSFRWAVPGVFDLRHNARQPTFTLPYVMRGEDSVEYGGLFLDSLGARKDSPTTGDQFPFCVAYPNLYLLTDELSALITHGQYLDGYWAFLGEAAPLIAERDLEVSDPLTIRQLVALNLPLSQLACSGLGQAGPLTSIVRQVQRDIKDGKFGRIERYIARLDDEVLDKMADYGWADPREWATDLFICIARSKILDAIKGGKNTRYDTEFLRDPINRKRFLKYFGACQLELEGLCHEFGYADGSDVRRLTRVMYGHTHIPVPWGNWSNAMTIGADKICCNNFGGWLYRERSNTGGVLEGAEVVLIESGTIRSVRIS